MERRKALIAAATIAGSLVVASTAYALTSGVVDGGGGDGAGELSPVVEVPASTSPTSPGTSVRVWPDDAASDDAAVTTGPDTDDDVDRFDDDGHESDDDGHESDEPFEYEGRDDDD